MTGMGSRREHTLRRAKWLGTAMLLFVASGVWVLVSRLADVAQSSRGTYDVVAIMVTVVAVGLLVRGSLLPR